jgi:hypothetical protein
MNVWYAAYGSNLSRARFEIYLRGGTPDGAKHAYPGCRDTSPPDEDVADEIDLELAFGGTSRTWGGGVAFVDTGPGPTKARLYLISLEQFEDVMAQENWLDAGSVVLGAPPLEPVVLDGNHMYRVVLPVGKREKVPVLTVTQPSQTKVAPPSSAYLAHVAQGLREAHAMSDRDIVDYLSSKRGVAGLVSEEELAEIVRRAE